MPNIAPRIALNPLINSPEIEKASRSLQQLNTLLANPSWENYQQLLSAQRYLIAGRFTYSYYYGWHFSTALTLMNEFDEQFKSKPDLSLANNAIREAIQLQEKILFVHCIQEILRNGGDLNAFQNQDSETFRQVVYYVAKEHGCTKNDDIFNFGVNRLTNYPKDQKTHQALKFMLNSLEKAYPADLLPEMRAPERAV